MKTVGIICEYDPFHKGHAYLLAEAKARCASGRVICVMSGNYTQRAMPAMFDKKTRAAMAIEGGADVVLELPTRYAMGSAPLFAQGAVAILKDAGADAIAFGAESEERDVLEMLARLMLEEPEIYTRTLHRELEKGRGFAAAREEAAVAALCAQSGSPAENGSCRFVRPQSPDGESHPAGPEEELRRILHAPGCILGVEYLKSCLRQAYDPEICVVRRIGAGHNTFSEEKKTEYLSASDIRARLLEHSLPVFALPAQTLDILTEALRTERFVQSMDRWEQSLYEKLTLMDPERLRQTAEVGEGLEYAILEKSRTRRSFAELVSVLSGRRVPSSRIRRILMNVCLGITEESRQRLTERADAPYVPYLKVLAFSEEGQKWMREYQQRRAKGEAEAEAEAKLPFLLTNPGAQEKMLSGEARAYLAEEARFTDLYVLNGYPRGDYARGLEYREGALRITRGNPG